MNALARLAGRLTIHRLPGKDPQLIRVQALAREAAGGAPRLADIGCGPRVLPGNVLRLDLNRAVRPHVIARAEQLPLRDGAYDGIVISDVLMYVDDPGHVARDLLAKLKPGGVLYCAEPFLYPDMGSASRWRFTRRGLVALFADADLIDSGHGRGPTSAALPIATYWLAHALSFGVRPLYAGLVYLFAIVLSPLVFLDYLLDRYRALPPRVYTNVWCMVRRRR